MIFIYRISNNSYNVPRFSNATKEHCFINFLENLFFQERDFLYIIADDVSDGLRSFLSSHLPFQSEMLDVHTGSNAASFRLQLQIAADIPDGEIVFLHEDDYLYKPHEADSRKFKFNNFLVLEGLKRSDYVSLYDHHDKYLIPTPEGQSKVSFTGLDDAKVFLTSASHWKYTDSTTLTFAVRSEILKQDMETWSNHAKGDHPNDFQAFLELNQKGRLIATPIPGRATHADPVFFSPFTDWSKV